MKRQIGVILLVFIATIGLSTAASAVPVTSTHSSITNAPGGIYIPIKTIKVHINPPSILFWGMKFRQIYRPPIYKLTARQIAPHLAIITIWKLRGSVHHGLTPYNK